MPAIRLSVLTSGLCVLWTVVMRKARITHRVCGAWSSEDIAKFRQFQDFEVGGGLSFKLDLQRSLSTAKPEKP